MRSASILKTARKFVVILSLFAVMMLTGVPSILADGFPPQPPSQAPVVVWDYLLIAAKSTISIL